MKFIPLTRHLFAIVDDDDFEKVSQYKWQAVPDKSGIFYARRRQTINGKRVCIRMHRFIISPNDYEVVDHINGNTLDNRKSNLRIATQQQNKFNCKKINAQSGFRGVQKTNKNGNTWRARIHYNGEWINLGSFNSPEEASRAYIEANRKFFGSFSPY